MSLLCVVKQIISGDSIVLRGQPKGGPPPEKTVGLSNIKAQKLARRPVSSEFIDPNDLKEDEPYAWEAREFLRKKLIGQEVFFQCEYKAPGSGREFGAIFLGKDSTGENIGESLVAEGLATVRRMGMRPSDELQQRLIALEEEAKAEQKGLHNTLESSQLHVRNIKWTLEEPRNYVESFRGKPVDAVIEHVRDGCTLRAFVLPDFQYVTVMLSGIKTPMFRLEGDKNVGEPFAEEAKYFIESKLLQRDVQIIFEGQSNQNLLGTIIHPRGNITELLLQQGYARCVDWSIGIVTGGAEALRLAQKQAKLQRLRIWKDLPPPVTPSSSSTGVNGSDDGGVGGGSDSSKESYTAKVCEVVNADGLVVKVDQSKFYKIFLASVRSPRVAATAEDDTAGNQRPGGIGGKGSTTRSRPLYDIPYMFEAREFLRKKLIGKKIKVHVDYTQPASETFPERKCCSVFLGDINIAEAIVGRGLATVIRYRQDDDKRSAHYDDLLAAEARAMKKAVGLHSKKDPPLHKVADVSGDVSKCRQFYPFLEREENLAAVVEYVASGARVRLYIPRETCLITFLLSGISCPRGSRPLPQNPSKTVPAEPFGDEAQLFTKELCLQREVQIKVEAMDKGGNFIGWLKVEGGNNLSVLLVEQGLAKVHFTAERSPFYNQLVEAESTAAKQKLNLWSLEEKSSDVTSSSSSSSNLDGSADTMSTSTSGDRLNDLSSGGGGVPGVGADRNVAYRRFVVTECSPSDLSFFAQSVDTGPALEDLMTNLRNFFIERPPVPGAFTPRKSELCAAKFSGDDEWYRARVERIDASRSQVSLYYVDYGNREISSVVRVTSLPPDFQSQPYFAKPFGLAFVQMPPDDDAKQDAAAALRSFILNQQMMLNVEYMSSPAPLPSGGGSGGPSIPMCTILSQMPAAAAGGSNAKAALTSDYDIGLELVKSGLVVVDEKRCAKDRRFRTVLTDYLNSQTSARNNHLNIWQYGDFRGDEEP